MKRILPFFHGGLLLALIVLPAQAIGVTGETFGTKRIRDVSYGNYGSLNLRLDIVSPVMAGNRAFPVVIYIHGGGWVKGNINSIAGQAMELASRGFVVLLPRYPLASLPAAGDDGEDAYQIGSLGQAPAQLRSLEQVLLQFIPARAAEFQMDPSRVGVTGISAGGHLAALLGVTWPELVRVVVSRSGPMDLETLYQDAGDPTAREVLGALFGGPPDGARLERYRSYSPLTSVDGVRNLPPFFLISGDRDQTVPRSQSEGMGSRLSQLGYPSVVHVLPGTHKLDLASVTQSVRLTFDYFDAYLRRGENGRFVTATAQLLFGRPPTGIELERFTSMALGGVPRTQIIGAMRQTPSAQQLQGAISGDYVEQVYRHVLDRASDPTGLNSWLQSFLRGELSVGRLLEQGFRASPEYRRRGGVRTENQVARAYAVAGDLRHIDYLYSSHLGRPGDAGGRMFWGGSLTAGDLSFLQIQDRFIRSPEYIGRGLNYFNWDDRQRARLVIARFYRAALDREGTEDEIEGWVPSYLGQGASAVASGFTNSLEYRSRFINQRYAVFLGRIPSATERNSWVSQMGSAFDYQVISRAFGQCPEYLTRSGGCGGAVSGLFQILLGRSPSPGELSGRISQCQGYGLASVAHDVAFSQEARQALIRRTYQEFLGRAPDAEGQAHWDLALVQGISIEGLLAGFLGSPEYVQKASP